MSVHQNRISNNIQKQLSYIIIKGQVWGVSSKLLNRNNSDVKEYGMHWP